MSPTKLKKNVPPTAWTLAPFQVPVVANRCTAAPCELDTA